MAGSGFEVQVGAAAPYEAAVGVVLMPVAEAVVRAAKVRTGESVLDLGCRTGFVARHALSAVGPTGHVVGVDPSADMLTVAEETCPPDVEWVEAPAGRLPFRDAVFDAVLCLQGLAAFDDRAGVVEEARRVLRPGGRAGFSLWAAFHCPYLLAQAASLEAEIGPEAAGPVWDVLPMRGDELLRQLVAGAGFASVDVYEVDSTAVLPALEDYVPAHLAVTPWGAVFAGLDAGGRHRVVDGVAARLAEYRTAGGRLQVPFSAYVAVAEVGPG